MKPSPVRMMLPCLLALLASGATAQVEMRAKPAPHEVSDPYQARILRARAHYEALRAGRLAAHDLTAQDLQDVIDFDRRLRATPLDNRSTAEKCVDAEVRRVGGHPSQLDWEVIRLKCR